MNLMFYLRRIISFGVTFVVICTIIGDSITDNRDTVAGTFEHRCFEPRLELGCHGNSEILI